MYESEKMEEVRRWKEEVYEETKDLSLEERRTRANNNPLWLEAKARKKARKEDPSVAM